MQAKIITQVAIIALLMLIGWALSKKGIITDKVNQGFSDMLMALCMPCLILTSYCNGVPQEVLNHAGKLLVVSCVIHLILILVCETCFRGLPGQRKAVMQFATAFSNAGFMGFPVLHGLYGNKGILYASIFLIPMNILLFSYGIMVFSGERSMKNVLNSVKNLPFLATFVGIMIALSQIRFPRAIVETMQYVGNMAIPLSMFIVGRMISQISLKDSIRGRHVYTISLIRLLLIPLVIFYALKFFHVDDIIISISVILEAMPVPTIVGMFANRFNGDQTLSSQCIFVSTALSIITIPLVVSVF